MQIDGISPKDVEKSLDVQKNVSQAFKAGEGAGKSGSFFFFSKDNRFIIKTLKGNEKETMLSLLDDYILHIKNSDN
jgi:1-phosphatidylinositol-4-phosphate 5-kinase